MMHLSRGARPWLVLAVIACGCQTAPRAVASRPPVTPPATLAGPSPRLEIAGQAPAIAPRPAEPNPQALPVNPKPSQVSASANPAPPVAPPPPEAAVRVATPSPQTPSKPVAATATANGKQVTGDMAKMKELFNQANAKFAGIDSYISRFRRREVVNGRQMPEDRILFKFRKEPYSIYFKWLDGTANEGREIIYVKGMYDDKIQVRTGKRDSLFQMQIALDLHSERATASSRHTMDEAGFGFLLDSLGQALASQEAGDQKSGSFQYLGPQQRPESAAPMECILQQVPAGVEKQLPRGGQRYWFFCSDTRLQECGLPVLLITYDDSRREVEYYFHDLFNLNVVSPQDFDPKVVWAKR